MRLILPFVIGVSMFAALTINFYLMLMQRPTAIVELNRMKEDLIPYETTQK